MREERDAACMSVVMQVQTAPAAVSAAGEPHKESTPGFEPPAEKQLTADAPVPSLLTQGQHAASSESSSTFSNRILPGYDPAVRSQSQAGKTHKKPRMAKIPSVPWTEADDRRLAAMVQRTVSPFLFVNVCVCSDFVSKVSTRTSANLQRAHICCGHPAN